MHSLYENTDGLLDLTNKLNSLVTDFIRNRSLAVTYAAAAALRRMNGFLKNPDDETKELLNSLEKGLPENITISMGLDLYALSRFPEVDSCEDAPALLSAISDGSISGAFSRAWRKYLDDFGMRCPKELDIATPRSREKPLEICSQLINMRKAVEPGTDARSIFDRAWKKREESFRELQGRLPAGKRRNKFAEDYRFWEMYGGYREVHKYYIIRTIDLIRKKALEKGHLLHESGVLRSPEDIFHLTLEQADNADSSSFDVTEAVKANSRFRETYWKNQTFPYFFDSRGKILRPPRKKLKENELSGESISMGRAEGKIKVLHSPDEKPVLPGEILVVRATDPGWTPLFVNAGGVILEVGGMSQHGAVVAREYGKPCVAGIENATEMFIDGETVLLDGTSGTISYLDRVSGE